MVIRDDILGKERIIISTEMEGGVGGRKGREELTCEEPTMPPISPIAFPKRPHLHNNMRHMQPHKTIEKRARSRSGSISTVLASRRELSW